MLNRDCVPEHETFQPFDGDPCTHTEQAEQAADNEIDERHHTTSKGTSGDAIDLPTSLRATVHASASSCTPRDV